MGRLDQLVKPLFRASFLTLGAAILSQGLGVVAGVLTARMLGPDDRGHLALILLVPMILGFLGDFGVDRAATFFAAQKEADEGRLATSLFILWLIQSPFVFIVSTVVTWYLVHRQTPDVELKQCLLAACIAPLSIMSRYGQNQLQGQLRMGRFAAVRVLQPLTYSLFIASLILASLLSVNAILTVRILSEASIVALSWFFVLRQGKDFIVDIGFLKSLVKYGIKGITTKISPTDTLQVDQWLVGLLLGSKDLAFYVVALSVLGPSRLVPLAFGSLIFPLAAKNRWQQVRLLSQIGAFGGVILACGMTVSMGFVLPLLFGREYSPAIDPARILAFASAALAIRELGVSALYGQGQPERASIVELCSAVTLLITIWPFVQWLGVSGAALAVGLSYLVGAVTAGLFTKRGSARVFIIPYRAKERAATFLGVVLASACLGGLIARAQVSLDSALIVLIAAVLLIPLVCRAKARSLDIFEPLTFFSLTMLMLVVLRPLAVISNSSYEWRGFDTKSGLTEMLWISLIGAAAWIMGYELPFIRRAAASAAALPTNINWATLGAFTLALAALALFLFLLFIQTSGVGFSWIFQGRSTYDTAFRDSVGYLYDAPSLLIPSATIATLLWMRGLKWPALGVALLGSPFLVNEISKGGRLYLLELTLGIATCIFFYKKSRPSALQVTICVVLAFFALNILRETRNEEDSSSLSQAVVGTITNPGKAWEDILTKNDAEAGQGLMFLALYVPDSLPYAPGSLIGSVIAQPIPRAIWPDKPMIPESRLQASAFPTEFARSRAGATFTAMGSFYLDSGIFGVALGMFITGCGFGFIWRYLVASKSGLAAPIAGALPAMTIAFSRASLPPAALMIFWVILPIAASVFVSMRRSQIGLRSGGSRDIANATN